MTRGSQKELDALHGLAAMTLAEELRRGRAAASQPKTIQVTVEGVLTDQPNPAYAALNPQLIDKVLKFLKDNGIDSPAKNPGISSLAEALRGMDVDEFHAPN